MRIAFLAPLGFVISATAAVLAACAVPPPSAYVRATGTKPAAQVAVGRNTANEACTQSATPGAGADVYCGAWQQPSARVRPGGSGTAADLNRTATASPWRAGLDERFTCQTPASTTILGGHPAELLQCTQRVGGWPHIAMVALIGDHVWYADGVLSALPAMERSIGVQSGLLRADAVPPSSEADALLAQRAAAQSVGSGAIADYDRLMALGTRANLADNGAAAEAAFRAALAVQQKALGANDPNTATVRMTLGLQLSNDGRFLEADSMFADAERLAPRSADPTAPARLLHYRGLDALNRGEPADALKLLQQAEAGYKELIPASALRPRQASGPIRSVFARRGPGAVAALIPDQEVLTDPAGQSALLGLIEAQRNEGVVLRELGRDKDSEAVLASANQLARSSGLARPVVEARLYRSTGVTAAAAGNSSLALTSLVNSTTAFTQALPESKPLADTYLLRAGELARAGQMATALPICRTAVASLVALKAGSNAALLSPCLDVYAAAAAKQTADSQTLLAEMFSAAQLMQGGITSQQIAQATARLQENARDPKVATAIRKRQDAASNLEALYRQRDELLAAQANPAAAAGTVQSVAPTPGAAANIDKMIIAAQHALADADSALQAAAPNFGQLVQQVVPASAVLAALHPREAFVSIALGNKDGWVFLLRGHDISIARIDGGTPRMVKLVKEIRAGTELTTAGLPPFNIAAAHELYQATLGGLGKGLDGITALTIAPTGPLLALPFEVLLTGSAQPDHLADAPWLLRKFAVSHVPAPSNFVSLRKIAGGSRATQPWFGFGDFQPVTLAQAEATFPGENCAESARLLATGLAPLPGARKELEAARLLLGASASDELLGRAFTAPAVMKTPLKDFRILHFATHALLPSELACQSEPAIIASTPLGARTANDALLTASDVVGMDLDADLIILSACNSGGPGGGTAGESLSGLARAFFYAGARALLVTHWDVNDQVAAYVVADTLRRLRETPGLGVAVALQQAQLGLLEGAGHALPAEVANPFFWAAFAVIGEGGEKPALAARAGSPPGVAASG